MNDIREKLLLYAITDRSWVKDMTLEEQIVEALEGGITILQLREKNLDHDSFVKEAVSVREICHRYGVPVIVNDRVDVALEAGCDGVHVGLEDMSVSEIRRTVPDDFIIGATAKTVEQAQKAEAEGADYLGVGAVFPSPTKKNAIRITAEMLKEITSSVAIPAVAIGGIGISNIGDIPSGAVDGVAVVSAIFSSRCIRDAARELKSRASMIIR